MSIVKDRVSLVSRTKKGAIRCCTTTQHLSGLLRQLRKKIGHDLPTMASVSGVSQYKIGRMENGTDGYLKISDLMQVADGLGYKVEIRLKKK